MLPRGADCVFGSGLRRVAWGASVTVQLLHSEHRSGVSSFWIHNPWIAFCTSMTHNSCAHCTVQLPIRNSGCAFIDLHSETWLSLTAFTFQYSSQFNSSTNTFVRLICDEYRLQTQLIHLIWWFVLHSASVLGSSWNQRWIYLLLVYFKKSQASLSRECKVLNTHKRWQLPSADFSHAL